MSISLSTTTTEDSNSVLEELAKNVEDALGGK